MNKLILVISTLLLCISIQVSAGQWESDERLYGVWLPETYVVDGKEIKMLGVIMFTPDYFLANVTFDLEGDGKLDGNANHGEYQVEGNALKLNQWMEMHWRGPGKKEHYLKKNFDSEIKYKIEGDKLIFDFPSGNKYISVRSKEL